MKNLFKLWLLAMVAMAGVACEEKESEREKPQPTTELEVTAKAMDTLIEQHGQYPYEEVGALINGAWRVDGTLLYSADYSKPLEIEHPMGTTLLPEKEECFLAFTPEGNISLYTYNIDYSLKQRTNGTWRFEGRKEQLTLDLPEERLEIQLRAVGDGYLILDWTNGEQAMRTLFKHHPTKELIDNFEIERITLQINSSISEGANYNREQATELLIGEWHQNTDLGYDQNWERIISCPLVDNYMFVEGGICSNFTISADGTYLRHYEVEDPSFGDNGYIEERGEWQFNPETDELTFTGEYKEWFKIIALTENYFVADYHNNGNHRTVYERR